MMLNSAPQDRQVFLTWNRVNPTLRYNVCWTSQQPGAATLCRETGEDHIAISQLANGEPYSFTVRPAGATEAAASANETTRERPGCSIPQCYGSTACFCTQSAADAWLRERSLDPLTFTCRNRPVTRWDENAPNCLYKSTTDSSAFLLERSIDSHLDVTKAARDPTQVRRVARQILWPDGDPYTHPEKFPLQVSEFAESSPGSVRNAASVRSFRISYHAELSTRISWFVPLSPVAGRYAIYHEGHSGAATDIGAETIDWLLDRGWQVIAMDMPLVGVNLEDNSERLHLAHYHDDFDRLDGAGSSPLGLFMLPIKAVVDLVYQAPGAGRAPQILMIGRSGGGWSTYTYSAIDPRITVAVPVAGGVPLSMRLPEWAGDLQDVGDYEQSAPHFYDVVSHSDLMAAAGSKASFFIHNQFDTCCYRLRPEDPLVDYLQAAGAGFGKTTSVYVDETNVGHSIGPSAYPVLGEFLDLALGPAR